MFSEDLRAVVLGSVEVIAAVEYDIAPEIKPEGVEPPYVIYSTISTVPYHTLRGPAKLATARVEFDSFAEEFHDAREIAAAIRKQIDGFKGKMGSTNFREISFADEHFVWDQETRLWRWLTDYFVTYREE